MITVQFVLMEVVDAMADRTDAFKGEGAGVSPALLEQLRQHVTNLMAATHLLTPVIRESGEAKYDQYLAIMNQSFYRLLRLMNHLEFTQELDQDDVPFCPVPMDLAGLCHELTDQVSPLAADAGVVFHYETESLGLLTTGDPALLRQLLLGLISNALRGAGGGGEAGLRLVRQRDCALITVWDSGDSKASAGSADTGPYRPDGGLGLGLPIARKLAALHGGAVMLEQRAERGMRATVSLPIRSPEPGALRTPASAGYDAAGGFSLTLVELADVLPYGAFLPEDLE
ncbi:MAG: ATP-binding protein [Pseudoflavonifractor sp.]